MSVMTRLWPRQKVFYGWWIVAVATFFWFYGAVTQAFGLQAFFDPMLEEFGWTRAETSLAFSLRMLEWGLGAPVVGILITKFGARRMILGGSAVAIVGFIMLSRVDSLGSYYVSSLVVATGWSAAGNAPALAAVVRWFRKKRALALAICSTGAAWSGLMIPLLVLLVDRVGWRTGYLLGAVGIALFIIPLSFVIRDRPEPPDYPDGEAPGQDAEKARERSETPLQSETEFSVLEALRTRAFWVLAVAMGLLMMASQAILVHQLTYMLTVGWARDAAGILVGATALFTVVGRLGLGALSDYIDKRYILLTAAACIATGLLLLATGLQSWWLVPPFLLIWGIGFGGPISVGMATLAEYFGPKNYPTISGLFATLQVLGGVVGPVLLGWMADVNGSYIPGLFVMAGSMAMTVPLLLAATRPMRPGYKKLESIAVR